jgi:CRP/FNR family transcriptional regulator, cyclic AMP receptor protein
LIGSAFAKGRDLLRGTLLFSGLSDEDADAILVSAHRIRYPARAVIFAKGAPGQSMMAILQGRVRISVPSSEGREAVFKIMGDGEIFGEIALLDGRERTADAVAITACELLVVERRAFLPVLRRRPELCIRLLELLCERLRRTDQQVEDLLIRHFENRLARTLLRLGQEHGLREGGAVRINFSLSQTELANLAGGTRESVNRHLHSLERLGVIALKGNTIVIRDAEALEQLG